MSVIKLEKSGSIATLTLTRPDMMNALGQEGDGPAVADLSVCRRLDRARHAVAQPLEQSPEAPTLCLGWALGRG